MEKDFEKLKRETIKVAKELSYDDAVIATLYLASTEEELSRIMCNARKGRM